MRVYVTEYLLYSQNKCRFTMILMIKETYYYKYYISEVDKILNKIWRHDLISFTQFTNNIGGKN